MADPEALLVGDIGGTNTRLTLCSLAGAADDAVTVHLPPEAEAAALAAAPAAAAAGQRCAALATAAGVQHYTAAQFEAAVAAWVAPRAVSDGATAAALQGQEAADTSGSAPSILLQRKYKNETASSLEVLIEQFLHEAQLASPPVSACLAVAGISSLHL
jgi:glucokinase